MDFLDFLESRGIKYWRKSDIRDKHLNNPNFVGMQCPVCGGDKLWLGYHIYSGHFACWARRYHSKYDLFKAWFPHENVGYLIRQIEWPTSNDIFLSEKVVDQSKSSFKVPEGIVPLLDSQPHCDYLVSRNLNPQILAEHFAVGAIIVGRYANRLFFPVFDERWNPVSWQTRSILEEESEKYIASTKDMESIQIRHLLYGMNFANAFDTVIIVEGVFDSIRLNTVIGKPVQALATFGKQVSKEQVLLLSKYPRRIICFDSEDSAQQDAQELGKALSCFSGPTEIVSLGGSKDPAASTDAELYRLLKFAGKL